jgi:hypothetical protein
MALGWPRGAEYMVGQNMGDLRVTSRLRRVSKKLDQNSNSVAAEVQVVTRANSWVVEPAIGGWRNGRLAR